MKCPKCNYTSFDYLDNCRKCGADLRDVRSLTQIIAVPPEEKAPLYAKTPEGASAGDTVSTDTASMFDNDMISADLGEPEGPDRDLLAGLNFDQSFDQMVETDGPAEASTHNAQQEDGLLDLDFGDVFGDANAKDKK